MQPRPATLLVPAVAVSPRTGRPSLRFVPEDAPVAVPTIGPGLMVPVPDGLPWSSGIDGCLFRGPGGLWRTLGAFARPVAGLDPRDGGAARPVGPAYVADHEAYIFGILADLVADDPGGEPARSEFAPFGADDIAVLLRGDAIEGPYGSLHLRDTHLAPFPSGLDPIRHACLRDAVTDRPGPDHATRAAEVRARAARRVATRLLTDGERTYAFLGVPMIMLDVPDSCCDATGTGMADVAAGPRRRDPLHVMPVAAHDLEGAFRYAQRASRYPGRNTMTRTAEAILATFGDEPTRDADVAGFLGHLALRVFDIGSRSWGKDPSSEARTLNDRLVAALTALAPWAGLGALGLVEDGDREEVAGRVVEAAALLRRSRPWMREADDLDLAVAYVEEIALPRIGATPDIDLGAPPDAAATRPEGWPGAIRAGELLGAEISDARGDGLGTVQDIEFDPSGKVSALVVQYRRRSFPVPFGAFAITRDPLDHGALTVTAPDAQLGFWTTLQPRY